MQSIPAYLLVPPAAVAPPLDTKLQELPLEQLPWEDFERLCLRLVQTKYALENCEIYGTKGQAQQGIDIFARKNTGKYAAYQCKRYQSLTEATLRTIVKLFVDDKWAAKSDEFVLCTSAALNSAPLQDAFNTLRDELATQGITLAKWDKAQLQLQLKTEPAIVYDFFGAAWVQLFNGEAAYAQVSATRKLDNRLVADYRRELRAFYTVVFNQYDPGLPIQELDGKSLRLEDRFIIPDVYEEQPTTLYAEKLLGEDTQKEQREVERQQQLYTHQLLQQTPPLIGNASPADYYRQPTKSRVRVDQKLAQQHRAIIIGDPGAGKSTLLRYLALDMLSDTPVLSTVARQLGGRLPVWLPFAYITKQLSLNGNYSLAELLRLWFSSLGKEHLFALVQQALEDERLVLLIDGVDEWTSQAAAGHAIAKIEIQANLRTTPIIYSSRPYGYNLLRDYLLNIQPLELAPFSRRQQWDFVYHWYRRRLQAIEPGSMDRAATETDSFFAELDKSADLKPLAENALLLGILVSQKLRDSVLPRNRLKALQDITENLINRRPKKRQYEAGIVEETPSEFLLEDVFAELAFCIQQRSNDGTILRKDAARVAENYLSTQMSYEPARAKKQGAELIDLSANSLGIIIEKSNDEIAFRHRQFQEYLAAKYLSDSDKDTVNEILRNHAAEQTWNQVIVSFFALIPSKQVSAFSEYLAQFTYEGPSRAKTYYLKLLRYDICLRLPNAPLPLAKAALATIQKEFELEQDESIKQLLLKLLLGAAENPRLKAAVFSYLGTYFPSGFKYSDSRVQALRALTPAQLSDRQQTFLLGALLNGNATIKLSASITLANFSSIPAVHEQVAALLTPQTRPDILAFALNVLATGAFSRESRLAAVAQFAEHATGDMRFFVTKLKVELGTHTDQDLTELLAVANDLGHIMSEELVSLLVKGWPTSETLFTTCLKCTETGYIEERAMPSDVAWKVLFLTFNKHEQVIDRIIQELETQDYPFSQVSGYHGWQYIAQHFRDEARLLPAIDRWLVTQKFAEPEIAFASLVGRTAVARQHLVDTLPNSSAPHWTLMALLEGWRDDEYVQGYLKEYFRGTSRGKHYGAHYLGQVFKDDAAEAIRLSEEMLSNRSLLFRERALQALIEVDRAYVEQHLLTPFLEHELPLLSKGFFGQYYSALSTLLEYFHTDERVKALVFDEKSWPEGHTPDLLIKYYPAATATIDRVVAYATPLAARYRLPMVEKLGERFVVDEQSLAQLAQFELEADELIRAKAAVLYFKHAKDKNAVREACTQLAFNRGFTHAVNRQIAFVGFLLLDELDIYFSLRDEQQQPNPDFSFSEEYHAHEPPLLEVVAEYFDRFYAGIKGDWQAVARQHSAADEQSIWGAFARHAAVDSPAIPHVRAFVQMHANTIANPDLLVFLAKELPGSDTLKDAALRLLTSNREPEFMVAAELLSQQFAAHADVETYLDENIRLYHETGKIVAATLGWPTLPILKTLFDRVIDYQASVAPAAGFQLKFLFRDVSNISEFLWNVLAESEDRRYQHRYFIKPLLDRVRRDEDLQAYLMNTLRSSEHTAYKVSCYALLARTGTKASELAEWKDTQQEYLGSYGYNIVENRVMSLSEVVRDVWY
ncbi:NACHT domain-containing protein [Hymenobacter arizonensis]|uniref:NACHT domain-containing protein n=1 Tax=Hymenobacter arizonensis TaxID=1227077 RepID=A0A1I6BF65_HYMAR|nr:NACHT domain-containing protein [Hymenobacter arizonensis]